MTNKQEINEENFKIILKKIYDLSTKDIEFRKLCLSEAKEAYKKVAGQYPSTPLSFKFVENPEEQYFKLPPYNEQDVSDEDIKLAAGEDMMTHLYLKATFNKTFRQLCLTQPNKAMVEISGNKEYSNIAIKFCERDDEQAFLLPPFFEKK